MEKQKSLTSSPLLEDPSLDLRRKIAGLKKAIIKEREEKDKDFEELENLKKKLSILELTLAEKDTQIQISNSEREKLEKALSRLSERSPVLPEPNRRSVAILEEQNKRFLDEYHIVKKKNDDLKAKYGMLVQQSLEIQKQINLKDNHLRNVLNELSDELSEHLRKKEMGEKDLNNAKNLFTSLSDSYNKLKNEQSENLIKKKHLEDEIIAFNKEIQVKQVQINKLNDRLIKQSEKEATLSSKLMQYKNELVEAESYYQKHEVLKLNNLMNQPAVIILKHDHTGEYVIEIEERNDKILYGIQSIEVIALHPHSDKRFYIKISQGRTMEFEATEAETLVSKMNYFLNIARAEGIVEI